VAADEDVGLSLGLGESPVVSEQGKQEGLVRVDVYRRLVLVSSWRGLWRPGNYAGSRPRIAERAAPGGGWWSFGGVWGDRMAPVWPEGWGEESD
jgi:hypothetical protein